MTQMQQIKHQHSMKYWKQILIAQQQSGLPATEYCQQQDIKYNAFYYWLRKIREELAEAVPQLPAETTSGPRFAVLSTAAVTTTLQALLQPSKLKLSCGPVMLEITESTSRQLLTQTLRCIKDVFPVC